MFMLENEIKNYLFFNKLKKTKCLKITYHNDVRPVSYGHVHFQLGEQRKDKKSKKIKNCK